MKRIIVFVVLIIVISTTQAQDNEYRFNYGSYYTANIVGVTHMIGGNPIRYNQEIRAEVFFHQYEYEKQLISFWTITFNNGNIFEIEERYSILYREDRGLSVKDPGYKIDCYSFKNLNDSIDCGVITITMDYKSTILLNLEVWDFRSEVTISIDNLTNIRKYTATDKKRFQEDLNNSKKAIDRL